jgi:Flp pilus assembly protein TadG
MLKFLRRAWKAKGGLAAVEFAFIAPVLITIAFGTIEVSSALECNANVTLVASTAADLVAQDTQVTNADMANIFAVVTSMLYPFPASGAKVVISSVVSNGSNGAKVAWSDALNGTARTVGSAVTVPTGLIASGGSVIYVEVTYAYTSPSTQVINAPLNMTNNFFTKPRRVALISRVP